VDITRRHGCFGNKAFRELGLFPSCGINGSGVGRGRAPTHLGPLEGVSLDHRSSCGLRHNFCYRFYLYLPFMIFDIDRIYALVRNFFVVQ
jgi:hypothetical protein